MSLTEYQINRCNKLRETIEYSEYVAKQISEEITVTNWKDNINKEHACIMHDDYTERDGVVDEHIITDPSCSYTKKFCDKFLDCDNDKCKYFKDYQKYCDVKNEGEKARRDLKDMPINIRLLAKFKRSCIPGTSWDEFVDITDSVIVFIMYISLSVWLVSFGLIREKEFKEENEKRKIEQEMKRQPTGQNTVDFSRALKLFEQAKKNTIYKQNTKNK